MNNRRRTRDKLNRSIKFNDKEIDNLSITLSKIILSSLKQYKLSKRSDLNQDELNILDRLIYTFTEIYNRYPNDPHYLWYNEELRKLTRQGIKLIPFDINDKSTYNKDIPNTPKEIWNKQKEYYDDIDEGLKLFTDKFLDF